MKLSHISFVWDFNNAHRIVAVTTDDWGLQACSLAGGVKPKLRETDEIFRWLLAGPIGCCYD